MTLLPQVINNNNNLLINQPHIIVTVTHTKIPNTILGRACIIGIIVTPIGHKMLV